MIRYAYPQRLVLATGVVALLACSLSSVRAFAVVAAECSTPKASQLQKQGFSPLRGKQARDGTRLVSTGGRETLDDAKYDLIVVGSGNGACGFLSRYLD